MSYGDAISASAKMGVRPLHALVLLAFQGGSVLFEGIGVAMMLPVFQLVQAGGPSATLMDSAVYWRWIQAASEWTGIPVSLATLLVASFTAIVARQVFTFCRQVYEGRLHEQAVRELRNRQFRCFLNARQGRQDESRLGEMVNDLLVETPRAVGAVVCVVRVAGIVLLVGFYVALLLALSPLMTGTALATLAVAVVLLWRLLTRSRATGVRITEANQKMSGFLAERLKATRLIRLSRTEQSEIDRMEALTLGQLEQAVRFQKLSAAVSTMLEPIIVAVSLTMLYLAVMVFRLPIEIVSLFLVVLIRLLPAVTEGVRMHNVVLGFSGSLRTVQQRLADLASAHEIDSGDREFTTIRDEIRFERVNFAYEGGDTVLTDLSLTIPAGKITGLVGPSGSGKSTLIDLLPRIREPISGRVLLDGVPVHEYSLNSLRNGIAYVPQLPQLFNITVRDHIRYGAPHVSEAEVRDASRLAGAAEFIERLPNGYDTVLGEAGLRLSGGQRQRLDIARALARRTSVLILDEPTSSLDAESESIFRETLRRIRHETTTTVVVIAHRLSTILEADQIVVLEGGRVSAIGPHHDLLQRSKWYRDAFAAQTIIEPIAAAC